jgi:hypothetical protein
MNRFKSGMALVAGITALAAAMAAIYGWHAHATKTPLPLQKKPSVTQAEPFQARSPAGVSPASSPLKNIPASNNYKKSFAESNNYWDYARQILPAAKAGNADAQLYLWKVLDYCENSYDGYFKRRSLDAGLRFAAEIHAPMETVQLIYDRCHELADRANELGNAMDWLARATASGQPVAQAVTAVLRLNQEMMKQYLKAGAAPTPLTAAPPIGGTADPQDLLRAAVESRDPEVLFAIGGVQGILNPSQSVSDKVISQVAWRYVACQRGLDCPANGEGSIAELIATAKDNWPAAQQLAQEINAKLDAGQWDELGLGATPIATSSQ